MLWTIERWLLHFCTSFCRGFPRVACNVLLLWALWSFVVSCRKLAQLLQVILLPVGLYSGIAALVAYNLAWKIGPGSPVEYPELMADGEGDAVPLVIRNSVTAKREGGYRHCAKCLVWKPDRTHHCSSCRQCRLRMDHHCPWFGTCIGFRNHKYFLQSLLYVFVFCFAGVMVGSLAIVGWFVRQEYQTRYIDVNELFFTITCAAFSVAMLFFAGYTLWLAANNTTTIESLEKGATQWRTSLPSAAFRYREAPSMSSLGNLFDLGVKNNLNQILGSSWLEWLLPIAPRHPASFNGTWFPVNEEMHELAEQRAQTELNMLSRR